ncbi:unnamed protein product [Caenorhabditis auriculariae]|uniref:Uncharacterized protein n=1 Tax=Caenorhabditis auriculariae TaxID=2777116 RepID=A0A8S1GRY1_9PELO|nr:unnamed protein product [Caenorhabditis auriculariae]
MPYPFASGGRPFQGSATPSQNQLVLWGQNQHNSTSSSHGGWSNENRNNQANNSGLQLGRNNIGERQLRRGFFWEQSKDILAERRLHGPRHQYNQENQSLYHRPPYENLNTPAHNLSLQRRGHNIGERQLQKGIFGEQNRHSLAERRHYGSRYQYDRENQNLYGRPPHNDRDNQANNFGCMSQSSLLWGNRNQRHQEHRERRPELWRNLNRPNDRERVDSSASSLKTMEPQERHEWSFSPTSELNRPIYFKDANGVYHRLNFSQPETHGSQVLPSNRLRPRQFHVEGSLQMRRGFAPQNTLETLNQTKSTPKISQKPESQICSEESRENQNELVDYCDVPGNREEDLERLDIRERTPLRSRPVEEKSEESLARSLLREYNSPPNDNRDNLAFNSQLQFGGHNIGERQLQKGIFGEQNRHSLAERRHYESRYQYDRENQNLYGRPPHDDRDNQANNFGCVPQSSLLWGNRNQRHQEKAGNEENQDPATVLQDGFGPEISRKIQEQSHEIVENREKQRRRGPDMEESQSEKRKKAMKKCLISCCCFACFLFARRSRD